MITGRCQCAKVQYEVDGEITDYSHCHCSICRRLHGAAFASWGGIAREKFSYVCGEDSVRSYSFSKDANSLFCKECGSRLMVDFKPEAHMLYITLGTVTGEVNCPEGYHQFVGSKAPWFEIHDALPQHDEWPDES